ncbi:MAG: GTPase HflX, partial [bacterium]
HLVASFRSTLEETILADLLLHLVDLSHPHYPEQMKQVQRTLEEMGLKDKPQLLVFNKIDRVEHTGEFQRLRAEYPEAEFISALKQIRISSLKDRLLQLEQRRFEIV